MSEFDRLCEDILNKSRKITRTERYPKGIVLDRDFIELLENEYFKQHNAGNRNFHSNFRKALSFELDKFVNNPSLLAKHSHVVDEPDINTHDIDDDSDIIDLPVA